MKVTMTVVGFDYVLTIRISTGTSPCAWVTIIFDIKFPVYENTEGKNQFVQDQQ